MTMDQRRRLMMASKPWPRNVSISMGQLQICGWGGLGVGLAYLSLPWCCFWVLGGSRVSFVELLWRMKLKTAFQTVTNHFCIKMTIVWRRGMTIVWRRGSDPSKYQTVEFIFVPFQEHSPKPSEARKKAFPLLGGTSCPFALDTCAGTLSCRASPQGERPLVLKRSQSVISGATRPPNKSHTRSRLGFTIQGFSFSLGSCVPSH